MRAAVLGLAALAALAAPATAEIRALVVGIDDYAHHTNLAGATNDARDIAQALREAGVRDLTVLLDAQATRAGLTAAWQGLLGRARPGDTLVFTYAGHGSQAAERQPGSEADGLDEFLLLHGFAETPPHNADRLVDDELHHWLRAARDRSLPVIFVADACHSGTLTRSLDARVTALPRRSVPLVDIQRDALSLDIPSGEPLDLDNVTYLSGALDNEQVEEVMIDGQPRGALSWAFARAVAGEADHDRDGVISHGELTDHVRVAVQGFTAHRQHADVQPRQRSGDHPVLPLGATAPAPPAPQKTAMTLAVLGLDADAEARLRASLTGTAPPAGGPADLTWDAGRREVISGHGDVVAQDIGAGDLPGVVAKWRLLDRLGDFTRAAPLTTRVRRADLPDDARAGDLRHRAGTRLSLAFDDIRLPWFTLFSLAPDGTIQMHFPRRDEEAKVEGGFPPLDFAVTPPFGADHVVAIATDQPVPEFHALLRGLDQTAAADRLAADFDRALAGTRVQVGVHGLYTAE